MSVLMRASLTVLLVFALQISSALTVFGEDGSFTPDRVADEQSMVNEEDELVPDPFEPLNRLSFEFNDRLYFWVIKPVARFYADVVPADLRQLVSNFFNNASAPVRIVNNLLQGKIHASGIELARFGINSTVGLLGLTDPAKAEFHLEPQNEDLGQTLGVYGIPHGFYIVWPILGPSTLRDTIGRAGDLFLNTLNYLEEPDLRLWLWATRDITKASFHIGEYESLKESAIDPYYSLQDMYIQYRNSQTRQ